MKLHAWKRGLHKWFFSWLECLRLCNLSLIDIRFMHLVKVLKYDKKYHVFMRDMCDVEKIVKELWMFAWHLYDVNDRLWDNCWSLMSSKEEVVEKPW